MISRHLIVVAAGLLALLGGSAAAQTITMKDGKVIAAKGLRRQGDQILATVEIAPAEQGKPAPVGELGYAVSQIARIEFPEPPILRTAPDLITSGKAADALIQLEPVVRYYEPFRDAPGSWWVDAALLKVRALAAVGHEAEGAPIATQIASSASAPGAVMAAKVQLALLAAHQGRYAEALPVFENALQQSQEAATLASANIGRAQCLLANKEWEEAVLSFLQAPVFYPGERVWLPVAQLGVAQAEFGMEDIPRAKETLGALLKTYPEAPEAALATAELAKIARYEKAHAAPK